MKLTNFFKIFRLFILVFLFILIGIVAPRIINQPTLDQDNSSLIPVNQDKETNEANKPETEPATAPITPTSSLNLDFGDGNVKSYNDVEVVPGQSLADVLFRLENQGTLSLSYQDYGGDLGIFIKSIDGVGDNGGNKWWQVWVNEDFLQVGVSNYQIKANDTILFKYLESKF